MKIDPLIAGCLNALGMAKDEDDRLIECVRVTRPDTHGKKSYTCPLSSFDLWAEFDGAPYGDKISIEYLAMTKSELDALGEFDGW